jgi:histone acetyltransferase (RNA polymerase elongator complex component)
VRATRLLKDSCYKLDLHLMPNLPGATVAMDEAMFQEVLHDPDLQVDQWKIYPCEITPWTLIKKWFEDGSYVPYPDQALTALLLAVLPQIPPWVRVNRVVRDIPSQYILAGMDRPNLRQDLDTQLQDAEVLCHDIRAREVKGRGDLNKQAELVVRKVPQNSIPPPRRSPGPSEVPSMCVFFARTCFSI